MGIKGLGKFLAEYAPNAVRQKDISAFVGRTVAVDASMSLYQFMIAIREGENFANLMNEAGEVTSHISGFLSRAIRLLENGIRPVYVFDASDAHRLKLTWRLLKKLGIKRRSRSLWGAPCALHANIMRKSKNSCD